MKVSVVMATHNRPEGLRKQLAALRAQTLPDDQYEIIVVDDGSDPPVRIDDPRVRVFRQEPSAGPAKARNRGWREAKAPLIAFTDDDCEATPRWLEAGLAAWRPRTFVQGPTVPEDPELAHRFGHFAHTLQVSRLGPWWETANMFYEREALELAGGFEEDDYSGPGGEDTDLGCTLLKAGYEAVWAPDAVMRHAVTLMTRRQKLRLAWRWDETMLVFRRHPELREHLTARLFWIPNHWWLVRALAALALPKRLWWVRWWLAAPYVLRIGSPRPDVAAYVVVHDLVEMGACARGALRYRVPVL